MSKCHIECIFKSLVVVELDIPKYQKGPNLLLVNLAKLALCLKVRFPCLKKNHFRGWGLGQDRIVEGKRGGGWAGLSCLSPCGKKGKKIISKKI